MSFHILPFQKSSGSSSILVDTHTVIYPLFANPMGPMFADQIIKQPQLVLRQ